ncbi:MAG: sugar O-acetyltransferase [Oscillospiraceae bacterium]|nr:sugar O-acetyltransferase [Oscillospiraceae bacterium]
MTEKEKAAAGYLYNANYDPEILSDIARCNDLCHEFNQIKPSDCAAQGEILKRIFGRMGKDIAVNTPFWCDYGYNTTVGDYFFANHNCQILDGGKVTFGDHVFIAPNCTFTTAEHALDAEQRNEGLEVALPITVGNNVWIGTGTIVLGGVTIGDNAVIGAGSVVTKDIPPNVIAVGVPCRVLREITEADKDRYPRYKG